MKTAVLVLAAALQGALATVTTACNADNCARAVTGTRYAPSVQSSHIADCSSFQLTIVTPSPVTVTVTAAPVKRLRRDAAAEPVIEARQVTVVPSAVPTYATACSGTVRYSSACSCAGITPSVTTVATPTVTVTVPFCAAPSAVCNNVCTDLLTDANNCGACGTVCPSGSTCSNGVCSTPVCVGSECGSYLPCGADGSGCICGITASGSGFCLPDVSCAGLPDCNQDSDCGAQSACIVGTCCGRNVCLSSLACSGNSPSRLLMARDYVNGTTGSPPVWVD